MKYLFITAAMLFFVGCSGRVQTNPLPDESKIHLPTGSSFSYQNKISQRQKDDFDNFANRVLRQGQILEITEDDETIHNNTIIVQDYGLKQGKPVEVKKPLPKTIWDKGLESNYE